MSIISKEDKKLQKKIRKQLSDIKVSKANLLLNGEIVYSVDLEPNRFSLTLRNWEMDIYVSKAILFPVFVDGKYRIEVLNKNGDVLLSWDDIESNRGNTIALK